MTDQTTTQKGVNDDVETAPAPIQAQQTEREIEMERIAARNQEEAQAALKEAPPEIAPVEPALDAASQLGKQLDNGSILLDEATLARAVIMQKIDGKEEMVPADKIFRQYQKGAAADLRLAEATRMQKEAAELLSQAQTRVANAATSGERKDAAADVEAAAGLVEMRKELFSALFSGDEEKAGKLLGDFVNSAVDAKVASKTQPAPIDEDAIVNRMIPKFQQRLSVDSALKQLFKDYPEIHDDADMTMIADRYVGALEAEGKTRAEAILLAGEAVGAKFKLGKYSDAAGRLDTPAQTTRDVKMEKKLALAGEPQASSARASTTEPPPQTVSQTIEEMRRARSTAAL